MEWSNLVHGPNQHHLTITLAAVNTEKNASAKYGQASFFDRSSRKAIESSLVMIYIIASLSPQTSTSSTTPPPPGYLDSH
jgi:hypothetical protein